jgi:GR25 family glycosyltransferase involved in LPS biosynthesis
MKFEFNSSNTFCISLSSSNRWIRIQSRFQYFNLHVTQWEASTPDSIVDQFSPYNNLNERQKACAQSHINIYKHMIEHQLSYALIFEDDACIDKQWREKLFEIETILDQDPEWDLIMLNASEPIIPAYQWTRQTEQFLTAGYIISLKGVRTIMNWFSGSYYSSDWMTTRLQLAGHSYSYFPWLVIQEGKYSLIQDKVPVEDYSKVVRCLNEINYSLDNYI